MIFKKLSLFGFSIFLVFLFSTFISAYCCSNPGTGNNVCTDWNVDEELAKNICCSVEANYFLENGPTSQEDCIENYFSENCEDLKKYCQVGCCADEFGCVAYVNKMLCKGRFSDSLNGRCEGEQGSILPECVQGCCCTEKGGFLDFKLNCQGDYLGQLNEFDCQGICERKVCISGCQANEPNFCKNGNIYEDCTGGDGIVGNGNDCGCSAGAKCLESGKCIEKTKTISIPQVDLCENVICGVNSRCVNGECQCSEGFFDNTCRAVDPFIDFDRQGCTLKDPCDKKGSYGVWIGILIFLLLLLFLIGLHHRKSTPPERVQEYNSYN